MKRFKVLFPATLVFAFFIVGLCGCGGGTTTSRNYLGTQNPGFHIMLIFTMPFPGRDTCARIPWSPPFPGSGSSSR